MDGSKIFGALTLVLFGAIIADVLAHPTGTTAAANGVAAILKPSYNAVLGYKA